MKLSTGKFVDADTPIYPESNFSWGEATKNLIRCPQDLLINNEIKCSCGEVEQNIIKLAEYLDIVREMLGNHPLIITSWYRPKRINKRVGGSPNSLHLYGCAADFKSNYLPPGEIYRRIEGWHGDKGGLGEYYKFIHIDLRGYRARW